MLVRVSEWVIGASSQYLGPRASQDDLEAYQAYLQAHLPEEVESNELKFWAEEAWEQAIRDWVRLVGPFYEQ